MNTQTFTVKYDNNQSSTLFWSGRGWYGETADHTIIKIDGGRDSRPHPRHTGTPFWRTSPEQFTGEVSPNQ